jgi:hypothetical protein
MGSDVRLYPIRTTQNHHFRSDCLNDKLCPACIRFELVEPNSYYSYFSYLN